MDKAKTALVKPLYLDLETVCTIVSLAPATVQLLVRQDQFPKPRLLSGRRVGWLLREIEQWAEDRPVSDLLPPANTGARRKKSVAATVSDRQTAAPAAPISA
ncbi:UNVERIFIED_ORG: prophage regulatory protein [Burkholderia sp. 1595]|uniref:Prophage regulatory protein n=1 Tax=Paraburkholderia terricola TaxID=169427 RepID=A0ABU1LP60_9BURK|nr:AlpA family phage regulatory protein [Paraburkholderia terricola]MDR6408531.1 prophage regulatory protein [Paraburkholderia terricola]